MKLTGEDFLRLVRLAASMRTAWPVTLLLLLPLLPLASAQGPYLDYDLQDPPEDLIVKLSGERSSHLGARPSIDVVRYTAKVEGEDIVQTVQFAGPAGEDRATLEIVNMLAAGARGQMRYTYSWTQAGAGGSGNATLVTPSTQKSVPVRESLEGDTLTLRFPLAALPQDAECFVPTGSISLRLREGSYDEYFGPRNSPCGSPDMMTVGFDGTCPPTPDHARDVSASFADASGDVEQVTYGQSPATVDAPSLDIVSVQTSIVDDRLVHAVQTAAPIGEEGAEIRVETLLDGRAGTSSRPAYAVVVEYERFPNASLSERIEGWLVPQDGAGERRDIVVWFEREGDTIRLSHCASLLPANRQCFSPQVSTERLAGFTGTSGDKAAASPDPCLAARAATGGGNAARDAAQDAADDTAADEGATDAGDQEFQDEDGDAAETGSQETPAPGLLALLGLLAAVAVLRRRA